MLCHAKDDGENGVAKGVFRGLVEDQESQVCSDGNPCSWKHITDTDDTGAH